MRRNALLVIAAIVACAGVTAEASVVDLGAAKDFAVLGASTVTNTGTSTILGDVGVSPGTAVTGFPPGIVTGGGTIHFNDALAIQAHADALTAYNYLAGLPVTEDLTGQDLGGLTLLPGVYFFSSSAQLTGQLTLNGTGRYVFQIRSALTTASSSSIDFINGASACGVYQQVGSSATLGTTTDFAGTIIAVTSDTLTTGASVDGRVIALTGAVTLDTNHIAVPVCSVTAVPLPSSALAGTVLLVGLAAAHSLRRLAARRTRDRGLELC